MLLEDAAHFFGQHFAQLHAPLVEGVDPVEEAFRCNSVLIHSEKLPARECGQLALEEQAE